MNPFIRSLAELTVISQSREQLHKNSKNNNFTFLTEDSGQRKRYIRSKDNKLIALPEIQKNKNQLWINRKKAISKFFDELDYNNQIQSSYDLTLLERQGRIDQRDAA